MESIEPKPIPGITITNQTVDPAISRVKFDRELENFIRLKNHYLERGIFLLEAEFPNIDLAFIAPKIKPRIVVFTARINFNNYDIEPPSVQFIDMLTKQPIKIDEMNTGMLRRVDVEVPKNYPNGSVEIIRESTVQPLIQSHSPHNIPFLCLPGVREYHNHPAHSNDPWLDHRGKKTEGTLGFILDQMYTYGNAPLTGCIPKMVNIQGVSPSSMVIQFNGLNFQTELPT